MAENELLKVEDLDSSGLCVGGITVEELYSLIERDVKEVFGFLYGGD